MITTSLFIFRILMNGNELFELSRHVSISPERVQTHTWYPVKVYKLKKSSWRLIETSHNINLYFSKKVQRVDSTRQVDFWVHVKASESIIFTLVLHVSNNTRRGKCFQFVNGKVWELFHYSRLKGEGCNAWFLVSI